jgi:hypothetical protein
MRVRWKLPFFAPGCIGLQNELLVCQGESLFLMTDNILVTLKASKFHSETGHVVKVLQIQSCICLHDVHMSVW